MKRILYFVILLFVIFLVYQKRENLYILYDKYFIPAEDKVTKLEKNAYYREYNFPYVKNTNNFIPQNKQDIIDIIYTVVNSGMDEFTFYCPDEYNTCLNDVNDIANSQEIITDINNFVHPYNSCSKIKTKIESTGRITLYLEKNYDNEMIILLNYKVDEIIKDQIKDNDSLKVKIRKIHDYIINNTSYDKERSDKNIINYQSSNAYGVLIEKYGLCGGYTDAMMLFLEKFKVLNIKISTENHIWNYVKVDNTWLHLDLTWDDPVTKDGKNILDDTYFLINDNTLSSLSTTEHNYNKNIYQQK